MSAVRCPMCGKANDGDADVCAFCDARLKPLSIDSSAAGPVSGGGQAEGQAGAGREGEESELPDWLSRIRAMRLQDESQESAQGEEQTVSPGAGRKPMDGADRLARERGTARGESDGEGEQDLGDQEEASEPTRVDRIRETKEGGDKGPPGAPVADWVSDLREELVREPEGDQEPSVASHEEAGEVAREEGEETQAGSPEEEEGEAEKGTIPPWLDELVPVQPEGPLDESALPPEELARVPERGKGEAQDADLLRGLDHELRVSIPDEGAADLAKATLPAWIQALRPVEAVEEKEEFAEIEEEAVETVGPLAGLLGTLSAEPAVAMPGAPRVGGGMLQITEKQYAQAEILRRLVDEEREELPAKREKPRKWPVLRWVLSLVLVTAIVLPQFLKSAVFPTPTRVTRDLVTLFETVESLPGERPALVVFDYEPGYMGELEAVAGALIDQLMRRELPVVTLSTRPSGPALAARLTDQVAAARGQREGVDYVHLGYLAGGQPGVLLFCGSPRQALTNGFSSTETGGNLTPWDRSMLRTVERLSDFGFVVVIAGSTESAKVWVEQSRPAIGETPLAVVLSAGAEPLFRPYYEARQPLVQGILSGLPSAVVYEQLNGRPGMATARWNGFGAGGIVATIALIVGGILGLVPGRASFRGRVKGNA